MNKYIKKKTKEKIERGKRGKKDERRCAFV